MDGRIARVIVDRRGIVRHFFPARTDRVRGGHRGIKTKHLRGDREGSDLSFLAHLFTCLASAYLSRDPTDLRKHALIYGGFHPSVAVGNLAIYENPCVTERLGSSWLIASPSLYLSLSLSLSLRYPQCLHSVVTILRASLQA